MKEINKKLISVVLVFLLLHIQIFGSNVIALSSNYDDYIDEIINYDESLIYNQFDEINELSTLLTTQNYSAALMKDSELIKNVYLEASLPLPVDGVETTGPPLGIPSFLWGCVFGIVGIVIVYIFTDDNKVELKKALNGCVIGYVVPTVIYVIVYAVFIVAATSSSTTGNLQYY